MYRSLAYSWINNVSIVLRYIIRLNITFPNRAILNRPKVIHIVINIRDNKPFPMFPGCNDQNSYWKLSKLTVLKITSLTVKYVFLLYENVKKLFSQWPQMISALKYLTD